mgnify:FL=1
MPKVNGKEFSYSKKGVVAAKKFAKKKSKKISTSDGYMMKK